MPRTTSNQKPDPDVRRISKRVLGPGRLLRPKDLQFHAACVAHLVRDERSEGRGQSMNLKRVFKNEQCEKSLNWLIGEILDARAFL